jgi:hypothetical protein
MMATRAAIRVAIDSGQASLACQVFGFKYQTARRNPRVPPRETLIILLIKVNSFVIE